MPGGNGSLTGATPSIPLQWRGWKENPHSQLGWDASDPEGR